MYFHRKQKVLPEFKIILTYSYSSPCTVTALTFWSDLIGQALTVCFEMYAPAKGEGVTDYKVFYYGAALFLIMYMSVT